VILSLGWLGLVVEVGIEKEGSEDSGSASGMSVSSGHPVSGVCCLLLWSSESKRANKYDLATKNSQ
jgi:hypothetical protein